MAKLRTPAAAAASTLTLLGCLAGTARAGCPSPVGPDVITGGIDSVTRWGRLGDITAYSLGVTICNIGDERVAFNATQPTHPAFVTQMFRLKDGRFEQIGLSWVRHEYFALAANVCCSCEPGVQGSQLGVGCSSATSAASSGQQADLSKRADVVPSSGQFVFPFVPAPGPTAIERRLQVHDADIRPSLNAGAMYFVEAQYVASDDAAAGNGANNASFRRVIVTEAPADTFQAVTSGPTERETPAIIAWCLNEGGVTITNVDVPGDERMVVGYKARDNGDGTWTYEYAVQNLTSDRAGAAFSVPAPTGVSISGVGFHDVDYHSGDPFDGTDWSAVRAGGAMTWSTQTFGANPNANALRFGTLYNFRFVSTGAPALRTAKIGLFKPGSPSFVEVAVDAPGGAVCPADLDGDGSVGASDMALLLGSWGACGQTPLCVADLDSSGGVGSGDLAQVLGAWGPCP